jgi:hypothetical protein
MWRIFRGCGHSFHIECNLPDISVCSICKSLVQFEVVTLGNMAVVNFDNECDGNDEANDNGSETSDDDDETVKMILMSHNRPLAI